MGKQQLFLITLVTIIIGIATTVTIHSFSRDNETASLDAVRNDVAAIASLAHNYFTRPESLGGGENSFEKLSFDALSFSGTIDEQNPLISRNSNAVFHINDREQNHFVIRAYPASTGGSRSVVESTEEGSGSFLVAIIQPDRFFWVNNGSLMD